MTPGGRHDELFPDTQTFNPRWPVFMPGCGIDKECGRIDFDPPVGVESHVERHGGGVATTFNSCGIDCAGAFRHIVGRFGYKVLSGGAEGGER